MLIHMKQYKSVMIYSYVNNISWRMYKRATVCTRFGVKIHAPVTVTKEQKEINNYTH